MDQVQQANIGQDHRKLVHQRFLLMYVQMEQWGAQGQTIYMECVLDFAFNKE